MPFPLPPLGVHTLVFGSAGTGKTSLVKGLAVEATSRGKVYYTSFEEYLFEGSSPSLTALQRNGVEVFPADTLNTNPHVVRGMKEALIVIDCVQLMPPRRGELLAGNIVRLVRDICESAPGSSLVLTTNVAVSRGYNEGMLKAWGFCTEQWITEHGKAPYLQARCVSSAYNAVGTTFGFRPWG